jgi:GT2 family glycosyltransferase
MLPKVSICVPNLNTRPFLPQRFETIFNQTFSNWELLVYDSHSTDGAWEYIQGLAEREPRMQLWQGPREGTPGSWSPCVKRASGEYVYIATSDDTMPPDCLERLVDALENHPECDLAHCNLRAIDEQGRDGSDWWYWGSTFARSSEDLLRHSHIRKAPFDGLLHLLGEPVYISITQLLIRRSLFEKIGLFESRWGSVGDFNWCMRAGLVANTVHVPETWGGWRLHPGQATAEAALRSVEHFRRVDDMIEHAIATSEGFLAPAVRRALTSRRLKEVAKLRAFLRKVTSLFDTRERRNFVLRSLLTGSKPARGYLQSRLPGRRPWPEGAPEVIRRLVEGTGTGPVLVPVEARTADLVASASN